MLIDLATDHISIGMDIVDVKRLQAAVGKFGDTFLRKIFTGMELAYCASLTTNYLSLSVRFTAKEAFSKALGTCIGVGSALKWHDVAIQNQDSGGRK
jgi:holo-[acyl-carrier protein] synthase